MKHFYIILLALIVLMACGHHNNDAGNVLVIADFPNTSGNDNLMEKQYFFTNHSDTSLQSIDILYNRQGVCDISLSQNAIFPTQAWEYDKENDLYIEPSPSQSYKRDSLPYQDIKSLCSLAFAEIKKIGFADETIFRFDLSGLAEMSAQIYEQYESQSPDSIDTELLRSVILNSGWLRYLDELFLSHGMIRTAISFDDFGCVENNFYTSLQSYRRNAVKLPETLIDTKVFITFVKQTEISK